MHKLLDISKIPTHTEHLHLYRAAYDVDGTCLPYEVVSRNGNRGMHGEPLGSGIDAVCIVPFFENGDVLATREFRYAIGGYCLEFPAGLVEPGETPVKAAVRELAEETGLDTKRVLFCVPGGFSSAGMTDEKVAVVGLEVCGQFHDIHGKEEIHCFRTTLTKLWSRAMHGEACSSRMQCFLLGYRLVGLVPYAYSLLGK